MFQIPKKHQEEINEQLNAFAASKIMLDAAWEKLDYEMMITWTQDMAYALKILDSYGITPSAGALNYANGCLSRVTEWQARLDQQALCRKIAEGQATE